MGKKKKVKHSLEVQRLRAAIAANTNRPKAFKNRKAYDRTSSKREWRKEVA